MENICKKGNGSSNLMCKLISSQFHLKANFGIYFVPNLMQRFLHIFLIAFFSYLKLILQLFLYNNIYIYLNINFDIFINIYFLFINNYIYKYIFIKILFSYFYGLHTLHNLGISLPKKINIFITYILIFLK